MCVFPFVKLKYLLICSLIASEAVQGFRLIQSPKKSQQDDHKDDHKDEKVHVFKPDMHGPTKEKYVNQSIKIDTKNVQVPRKFGENDSVIVKLEEKIKAQFLDKIAKQNVTKTVKLKEVVDEKKPVKTIKPTAINEEEIKPKQKQTLKNDTLSGETNKPIIKDTKIKTEPPEIKVKKDEPKPKLIKNETSEKPAIKDTKPKTEPAKLKQEEPEIKLKKELPKKTPETDVKQKKEVPNTPRQPVIKEAPKTPKQPITKEAPKTPKQPVIKEVPKTPKQPVIKEVPKAENPPTKEEPVIIQVAKTDQKMTRELRYNLPSFFLNFGSSPNEECRKQGQIFLENFKNNKLWALRMFDSSAKIPSNILKGNLNQLGDYDQCLEVFAKISEGKNTSDVKISGKYCLSLIDITATTQDMKLPVNLAQGRALIRSKIQDPGHFIPRFTTIKWGVCIPAACTAEDAEEVLTNTLKIYNGTYFEGVKLEVSVDSDDCHVRKSARKSYQDNILMILTTGLLTTSVIVTFIATISDNIPEEDNQESGKLKRILLSFSLKRTVRTLFNWESEKEEIKCIHGIRTICTLFLYVAHKIIPLGHTPFTNRTEFTEVANNVLSVVLRMSIIYTDSFLLLSGVLMAYHMSKDMETKGYIPWLQRIFARFMRLTPSLLVVLLYYAYVMDNIGDGPLWNTVVTSNSNLCKENWWRNILFVQNMYPFEEMCATHTHQLALDMQLFLITPVLVWLLYRKPMLGVVVTLFLHVLSVALRYYTTMNYRLSIVIYHGISITQLYRTANMMYASTLHRITPYIAGVGLGVVLQQIKSNYQVPKVILYTGWTAAGYFVWWTLATPAHLAIRTYKYDVNEAAQFASLSSVSWSLALTWIIFACHINTQGYVYSFLSSHFMIILSKLSYTIYLVQFTVFFYKVGTIRTTSEFDPIQSFDASEFIIVIGLSLVLTLSIDLPVQRIKKILMPSTQREKVLETQDNDVNVNDSKEEDEEYSEEEISAELE